MTKATKLMAGAPVRVYRPGGGVGDCQGTFNVPDDGSNLYVRTLAPGLYEARQETGREVAFEVLSGVEYAVLLVEGAEAELEGDDSENPNPDAAPRLHEGRQAPNEQSWLPHMPNGADLEPDLNPPAPDEYDELTGEDLDEAVRKADVEGRSTMTADEKRAALRALRDEK